jgi:hypothetical protein
LRWLREHPAIGTALAVVVALALAVLIVLAVASDLSTAGSLPTTNGRTGALGTPVIERYDLTTHPNTGLTGPGYLQAAMLAVGKR